MTTRTKILAAVLALAAVFAALWFTVLRSKPAAGPVATATTDAGAAPPPKLVAPSAVHLAADDGAVTRDDDPRGTLRLFGQVVDERVQPVGGATVAIDANPPQQVVTEADGAFEFTGLIGRDYRLEAHGDAGHAGPVQLRLTDHSDAVTLHLVPGGVVNVVVTDAFGTPVLGAEVELRSSLVIATRTGPTGIAELRGVGAGWSPLHVAALGFAPTAMMLPTTGDPAEPQRVAVTLARGVAVRGRVVDDTGKPVPDARVLAVASGQPFPVVDARRDAVISGADGQFLIVAVAAGTYRFTATHPDFAPATTPPMVIDGKNARDDVELLLERGAAITGVVRSPDGATVAAADVRVVGRGSVDWRLTRQAFTDDSGRFRIDGLPRRAVDVVAWHPSGGSPLVPVDLVASPTSDVVLTLALSGAIAGIVVDGTGEPIGDAQLVAEPVWTGAMGEADAWAVRGVQATLADSGGAFRFAGLPDGRYHLHAARPRASEAALWLSAPTPAHTGDTALRLVLAADGEVIGRVVLPDGKPPSTFTIAIGAARPVPFAAEDGSFAVIAPGGAQALDIAGGTFVQKTVRVDVVPGDTVDLGTITVTAGRSISGRVLDPTGAAVAGAKVAAGSLITGSGTELYIAEEGFNGQDTVTDDHGRYSLAPFGPYPITIVAGKDGVGRSSSVQVPRGPASATVDLVLAATGALEGRVTSGGTAVADTPIIANPIGATRSNFFSVTGPDGSFALDTLTAGPYLVYPMIGGGGSRPKDMYIRVIDVVAGGRARADIDASPGGASLELTAKGSDGTAVTMGGVALLQAQVTAPTMEALRDATWLAKQITAGTTVALYMRQIRNGPAKFEGVVEGSYSVCVTPVPAGSAGLDGTEEMPMHCQPIEMTGAQQLEVVVPAEWLVPPPP